MGREPDGPNETFRLGNRVLSEYCATFRIAVAELKNERDPQSLRYSSCPCRTKLTEYFAFRPRSALDGGLLAITRTARKDPAPRVVILNNPH